MVVSILLPIEHRAHAAAASQMRDDDPPRLRYIFPHLAADVLVRDAVITPMPDATGQYVGRQGISLGHVRHSAMERAIEAGHLRKMPETAANASRRRQRSLAGAMAP